MWLLAAEEGYVATLNILAERPSEKRVITVGRAYFDLSRLADGKPHRFRFVVHEPMSEALADDDDSGVLGMPRMPPITAAAVAASDDDPPPGHFEPSLPRDPDGSGFRTDLASGHSPLAASAGDVLVVEEFDAPAALRALPVVANVVITAQYQLKETIQKW